LEQIPETRSGKEKIAAVVVDEESGSANQHGFGAKILCGEGALDLYLAKHGDKELTVRIVIIYFDSTLLISYG
jgi:ATP-dependent Clp protease ATP-binding subunit ClpX